MQESWRRTPGPALELRSQLKTVIEEASETNTADLPNDTPNENKLSQTILVSVARGRASLVSVTRGPRDVLETDTRT